MALNMAEAGHRGDGEPASKGDPLSDAITCTDSRTAKTTQGLPVDYALSAMHSAALRARLAANDAETIGLALKAGLITAEAAIVWACDCGLFDLIGTEDFSQTVANVKQAVA